MICFQNFQKGTARGRWCCYTINDTVQWSFHSYFPVVISTNTTTFEELEERRLIFKQPEATWYDVDIILPNEVPEGFDMDVLSKFLSQCHVTINDEPYTYKIRKPTKMGRKMYISKSIKRAWFCRTDDSFRYFVAIWLQVWRLIKGEL